MIQAVWIRSWINDEALVSLSIEDVNLDEGMDEWEVSASCVKIGRKEGIGMDVLHVRSQKNRKIGERYHWKGTTW